VIDPVKPPPSTSRARAKGTRDVENLDIEAIDLTQDNREVSLVSPRREKRGQKRKSDEFEQDCRKVKSPRPAKPAPAPSPAPFDAEEFPDITDISPFPTSPPPPYSTTEPAYQAPADIQAQDFDYQDDDDLGFRVPESDEGEYCPDAEPYVPQANRKRKSLSRVPSNASIPPRKMGKQIKELSPAKVVRSTTDLHQNHERPRPTPTRKVRQAVMDSEDDGTFEDLDEMELEPPSPIDTSKPQLHKSERSFAQPLSQRSHRDQQVPASLPIRSPAKSMKVLSSQGLKLERVPTTARSPQALQTRLSPVKAQSPQRSDAVLQSSSSARSKENRDNIRRAVEDFLKAEGPRLPEHLKNACRNWDREVKAYQEQIEEFGQPDQSTDEKVQAARSRKNAVEKLVTLESEHRRLTTKREENRRKIKNDLENGIFTIDGSVAFKLNKALEEVEEQIYKLLDVVRLQSPFKTPQRHIDEEEVSEVMVRSTQHTPAFRTKDALHSPRAHHIPETQYVKQSEISVREVWTPSKEIRFAENFAESPPPPQEYSNNVTFRRGLQTDKASPQPKERSHRVPETPRRHSKDLQGPGQSKSTRDSIVSGYESFHTPDDFPDGFDDDDNLFSNHMGSPPCNVDQDENFCDDDDADFLDDLANIEHRPPGNFDWKGDRIEPQPRQLSKEKETTVARTRQKKSASSPQKTQSTTIGMNHPWSEDVKAALLQQFGLRGFRPGQLEAVNATLNGDHCFVLMPTGGGKSLCYQLPSVIRSGKTRGVTIVISPLLSLMEDQVEACRNRFGMQAHLINGETTKDIKDFIMSALGERDPQSFIQVLYVTPEMLSKSTRMIDSFQKLYQNGNLARIVIDEAHCVSQWGHDFRPDYKALGNVLRQFSGVPIMALTATATQLVQTDVIANLGIRGCRKFSQSFNRPNLSYEVREKKGKVIPNIAELIQSKYPKKSGIVYCLARKTCESVAQQLTSLGVRAHHYHAGMESAERSAVQRKWQSNEYHVIVATIAFGMGIDKADVRFVIHHSLPKSLEGYYQETGRAGRDGKRSGCYLFYNYGDSNSLRKMIEDSDGNREQKQRQHDMLRNVIQFCENKSDCRRAQVLNYFSEQFRPEDCNQTCDNCRSDATYEEQDLTQYAVAALNLVAQVEDNKVTKLQCIDAFRGAKGSKLKPLQLEEFGFGQSLHRGDVERLFSALLQERALREESVMNKAGFATNYLKVSPRRRNRNTTNQC
jgi:bloom syndrome protein